MLCGVLLTVSLQLLRGSIWGQRFLLGFWTVAAMAAALGTLSRALWGVPDFWPKDNIPLLLVTLPVLVGAGGAATLLYLASATRSRLRYGSVVTISVGAALALTVAVNMIAQTDYYRDSMESLGIYGLSDRTGKVLDGLEQDVTLTCVYTSKDKKKLGAEYAPRVIELLEEMGERSDKVKVAVVTNDTEKDALVQRLRKKIGGQASQHTALLTTCLTEGEKLLAALEAETARWVPLQGESYLATWAVPTETRDILAQSREELARVLQETQRTFEGTGLPDYPAMVSGLTNVLKPVHDALESQEKRVRAIGELLASLSDKTRLQAALSSLDHSIQAAEDMAKTLGAPGTPLPDDPAAAVKTFVVGVRKAAAQIRSTARMLEAIGGEEHAELVRGSRTFRPEMPTEMGMRRIDLISLLDQSLGGMLEELAADAESIAKVTKADFLKQTIGRLRTEVAQMVQVVSQICKAARGGVEKLTAADAPSQDVLKQATEGKLFAALLPTLRSLIDEAEKLPELKNTELTTDITGDNIVIVETESKAEVIGFDEVWAPRSGARRPGGPEDEGEKRDFSGNSAIGSRILRLTHAKLSARVLLTHYEPQVPPQMQRMMPPAPIPPRALSSLRTALEQANFEVTEWNLTEDKPVGEKDLPQVLIVLPPPPPPGPSPFGGPPPGGGFGPEQLKKLSDEINSGTPAIFLATFLWPQQMSPFMPPMPTAYALGDYLRNEWGIDVRTNYRVIPAVVSPDEQPGMYSVDPIRISYLPLNAFAEDHPIGRPLAGRRVLWTDLCPIFIDDEAAPEGVKLTSLLDVPEWWNATWATTRAIEVFTRVQNDPGGTISPDFSPRGGDLPAGFPVAVVATRQGATGVEDTRIVVLGMGTSLTDGYLNQRIPLLRARGDNTTIEFAEPPRANTELAVNSVFWLVGMEDSIAAGPMRIKPVQNINRTALWILRALFVVGLPLMIVGAGGLVLVFRRR